MHREPCCWQDHGCEHPDGLLGLRSKHNHRQARRHTRCLANQHVRKQHCLRAIGDLHWCRKLHADPTRLVWWRWYRCLHGRRRYCRRILWSNSCWQHHWVVCWSCFTKRSRSPIGRLCWCNNQQCSKHSDPLWWRYDHQRLWCHGYWLNPPGWRNIFDLRNWCWQRKWWHPDIVRYSHQRIRYWCH